MKKNRGVVTMMIRRSRGQWILLRNFRQILGFTFYRGRLVGWMTVVVVLERDNCVMECDPLSRWEPNELRELLVQDSIEGTQVIESGPPSNWVSQLIKNFCNMVDFPIVYHEAQCLALFRLLE